ncbi:MAG: ATP-dependent RecD-like DNA helicase [Oscillospiraceae bacterium]|jgi:exodeoxyribonuclease V alpha subunit|nr:ATP-dependent RecD-like DNA helicase [Oscillospiraceae bacterium]
MDETVKTISGTVDGVIFKNAENGYVVLELDCDGSPVTVVGCLGDIAEGEKLSLTGGFITSPKYGEQFKAETCERQRPTTPEEIARYIGSGIIKGLGIKTAVRVTEKFGEATLDVMENAPERLSEVKGITREKAVFFGAQYRKLCGVNTLVGFLSEFGISPAAAVAVWQKYNNSSIALIKENPYLLCDEGVGLDFEIADKTAEALSSRDAVPFDFCGINRVKAGITYILSENAGIGHTCLPAVKLRDRAVEHLGISRDAFDAGLYGGADEGRFSVLEIEGKEYACLSGYYRAERYITDKLTEMLKLNFSSDRDFSREIADVEQAEGISYEALQKAAINGCLVNNLFILTGGPGTGKTTTLNAVIRLLKRGRKTLSLAAPTGRAAKRMSELTGERAQTIHRLLEVDMTKDDLLAFKKNELNPLKADAVIIDEMSMVDALLFEALLRAVKPDAKLILVGDSDQLPSVGAGNILRDLISSGVIPGVRLTEIFRQAAESLIVVNAHKIVKGREPELNARDKDFFFIPCGGDEEIAETVVGLVKTRLPAAYGLDPFDDIQVLAPAKIGAAGTRELNKMLQDAINPASVKKREMKYFDAVFRTGDKVMQVVNDYNVEWKRGGEKGMGIFNGDIGIIVDADNYSGGLTVNFDGRAAFVPSSLFNKIEHAFAITVHKSQGSEYKAVIMPVSSFARRLLYRSLLYTGVTRARDLLIVVGKRETILKMAENERGTSRYSCLKSMITGKAVSP